MIFQILGASSPRDSRLWRQGWLRLPAGRRDVYYLPEFLLAYQAEGRGDALCAMASEGEALWLYPFLRAPLPQIGPAAEKQLYDIQSAYGYAGPVVNPEGESPAFLDKAWSEFSNWCRQAAVIAEFVRFHPLLQNQAFAPSEMTVRHERTTLAVDLGRYPQSVWDDATYRTHRNMVRKATRLGFQFGVRAPLFGELDWFCKMYEKTQDRLEAIEETRFSATYFSELLRALGDNVWLGTVSKAKEIISAVIVFRGSEFAHCHLMGYTPEGAGSGVSNLLYHGVAVQAASHGLRLLHMGGGRTKAEGDALYRFKSSFAHERFDYCIGTRCHDPAAFASLRSAWGQSHAPTNSDFFLFYRFPRSPAAGRHEITRSRSVTT